MNCQECGREIEECACCESGECTSPVCYADMAVDLKQSAKILHEHGG